MGLLRLCVFALVVVGLVPVAQAEKVLRMGVVSLPQDLG